MLDEGKSITLKIEPNVIQSEKAKLQQPNSGFGSQEVRKL